MNINPRPWFFKNIKRGGKKRKKDPFPPIQIDVNEERSKLAVFVFFFSKKEETETERYFLFVFICSVVVVVILNFGLFSVKDEPMYNTFTPEEVLILHSKEKKNPSRRPFPIKNSSPVI